MIHVFTIVIIWHKYSIGVINRHGFTYLQCYNYHAGIILSPTVIYNIREMENCDIIKSIGYFFTELLIMVEPDCVILKRSIFIQKIN